MINRQERWVIRCEKNGEFRIGSIMGRVPNGKRAIIEGFHIKGGKVVRKGTVTYLPRGKDDSLFEISNNTIEP